MESSQAGLMANNQRYRDCWFVNSSWYVCRDNLANYNIFDRELYFLNCSRGLRTDEKIKSDNDTKTLSIRFVDKNCLLGEQPIDCNFRFKSIHQFLIKIYEKSKQDDSKNQFHRNLKYKFGYLENICVLDSGMSERKPGVFGCFGVPDDLRDVG